MGDAAANWDLIRSFAATFYERRSLVPFNAREAETFMRVRVAAVIMRLLLHVLSFSLLGWLAWNTFQLARAGTISVGTFTMIISIYMMVGAYTRSFGDTLFAYYENLGQLTDALKTILAPHEIVDPPGAVPLNISGGAIDVRDIDFAYADGTWVFQNFSLHIAAGEKIGLVGASGAGKSSLIKIIRRQFPLSRGQVLIDGQDVATVTWDSVHDVFAEVPQNPGMFHRSVRENIAYGRPDATEAEVIAAAKAAHCHEFIVTRAAGYESIVGEKGMKLSGGEKQRVAIARAFLKNAPILLLDEATSSLDSEAEHLIQDALLRLMRGRTVIAIAHRLSTIMHLDRIIVLAEGRVVEEGTHAALLARSGAYARLWQHQVGGFM
jgi:ATP-binding cassette subfamily B protein